MARAAQSFLRYECCLDSRVSEDALTGDFKNPDSPFLQQCTAGPYETMTLCVPEQIGEDLVLLLDSVVLRHFLQMYIGSHALSELSPGLCEYRWASLQIFY